MQFLEGSPPSVLCEQRRRHPLIKLRGCAAVCSVASRSPEKSKLLFSAVLYRGYLTAE